MKKSLIALAVLGSVAGLAQAQSSVSVYGVVDAVLHKDKGVSTQLTSGGVSGSRLGFKGSEDLGGGLKANFLLEHGFNVDTGAQAVAGQSFNRQAYVGLSGGFGEFKLGNVYTAYDDIAGAANGTFDSVLAPEGRVMTSYSDYTSNPRNNLYFATPVMGGVSGAISASVKEGGKSVSGFHVKYEGGPVFAGLAYQKEGTTKFTRLLGSYDLGAAKLMAGFGRTKVGSVNVKKTNDFNIGADVPLASNLTLSSSYATSKVKGTTVRKSGLGLGVAYSLSKRTTLYGGFLKTRNVGPDTRYGFGVKHTF